MEMEEPSAVSVGFIFDQCNEAIAATLLKLAVAVKGAVSLLRPDDQDARLA